MVAGAGGALSRAGDALATVGATLAVVSSAVGVIAGVAEIIRDVRYAVGAALGRGDGDGDDDGAGEGGGDALGGSGRELAPVDGGVGGAPISIKVENNLMCGRTISDQNRRGIQFENLPEDVLCTIFSKLQLKEVARTSVVSSKWRRMWTLYPKLRFDGNTMCGSNKCGAQQCTQKFIGNVNGALQQLHGKVVEAVEIKFEFDMMLVDHLNNWISFAVSSRTKSIAFDLVPEKFRGHDDRYAFPFERLNGESTLHLQCIQLSFVSFKPPSQFIDFPNLRRLDLHIVNISAKDLQDMLSSCSRLEWLSIVRCHLNDELKLDRPLSPAVLQVAYCRITKIELHAAKLKTFIYRGED